MIKGQKKLKLGRKASHKNALVKNLLRSLFTNGYLTTTTIKAKALREEALKLAGNFKAKSTLSSQRYTTMMLGKRELVEKLEKYLSENELKIKVAKIGYRDGDKAQTSRVSLIGFNLKKDTKKVGEDKKSKKETKEEVKVQKIEKKGLNIGKSIKDVVAPRTERARSRSGL